MHPKHRWTRYDRNSFEGIWFAIEDVREAIDDLVTADEVAAAVSERLRKDRTMVVGLGGKLIGVGIALGTLATAIHSWIG